MLTVSKRDLKQSFFIFIFSNHSETFHKTLPANHSQTENYAKFMSESPESSYTSIKSMMSAAEQGILYHTFNKDSNRELQ